MPKYSNCRKTISKVAPLFHYNNFLEWHDTSFGAKRPPPQEHGAKRPAALCPQTIIWAHNIIYALLLIYVTGYRILGHFLHYRLCAK